MTLPTAPSADGIADINTSLYQPRDYSDLTVFANDGSHHPVHRAIVCPRSQYFFDAVREGRWKDGIDGHLALPDDEPEVLRLLIEYFYLLDYTPTPPRPRSNSRPTSHPSPFPDTDSSDSLSTLSRDPAQYGNIYGASAVSAFGGPQPHLHPQPQHGHPGSPWVPPAVYLNRSRTESQLTVHALPLEYHGNFGQQHRHPKPGGGHRRGSGGEGGPEVSPLATEEPDLVLHARMYAAGRKFGVEGLKALALDKFKIQLTRHWSASTPFTIPIFPLPDRPHQTYLPQC